MPKVSRQSRQEKASPSRLEVEQKRLLEELLEVMERIGLHPPEKHLALYHLHAYEKKKGKTSQVTTSGYKDPFLQDRALDSFSKLDRQVMELYDALWQSDDKMSAEKLLRCQQEIAKLSLNRRLPYTGEKYQCAFKLHKNWLEAKDWEQFRELMPELPKKLDSIAHTDWNSGRRLGEQTAADIVKSICCVEKFSPKTIRQWRKRWANFGYWDPESGYLLNGHF